MVPDSLSRCGYGTGCLICSAPNLLLIHYHFITLQIPKTSQPPFLPEVPTFSTAHLAPLCSPFLIAPQPPWAYFPHRAIFILLHIHSDTHSTPPIPDS